MNARASLVMVIRALIEKRGIPVNVGTATLELIAKKNPTSVNTSHVRMVGYVLIQMVVTTTVHALKVSRAQDVKRKLVSKWGGGRNLNVRIFTVQSTNVLGTKVTSIAKYS